MDSYVGKFMAEGGSFITLAKGNRSKAVTQVHIHTYIHTYMNVCMRVCRSGCHPSEELHDESGSAGVSRAGHGGGLEDWRRELPGVHRRRWQRQWLLLQVDPIDEARRQGHNQPRLWMYVCMGSDKLQRIVRWKVLWLLRWLSSAIPNNGGWWWWWW